jgi:hypothetical protein
LENFIRHATSGPRVAREAKADLQKAPPAPLAAFRHKVTDRGDAPVARTDCADCAHCIAPGGQ